MKFRSQVYTAVSGSIGGLTYAHNSGGMYTRGRATPTNPNSAAQQAARNAFGSLATAWRGLSQAVRDTWTAWAVANPVTDAFGDPLTLSGQQMYNRLNQPRVRAGEATVSTPPASMGMSPLAPLALSFSTPDVELAFDSTDPWANADGGFLFIQTGIVVARSINFYAGPWRYLSSVAGDTATPPTSPESDTTNAFGQVYSFFSGNRQFYRVCASDSEGRLSTVQIVQADI